MRIVIRNEKDSKFEISQGHVAQELGLHSELEVYPFLMGKGIKVKVEPAYLTYYTTKQPVFNRIANINVFDSRESAQQVLDLFKNKGDFFVD